MSNVLSQKGSRCAIDTNSGIKPRCAMKLLNGPPKLRVDVIMVTLYSLIRAANVPVPPPMSSPIRTLPLFLVASSSTSSMVKSMELGETRTHRCFSLPWRSKQSRQSANTFCCARLFRHSKLLHEYADQLILPSGGIVHIDWGKGTGLLKLLKPLAKHLGKRNHHTHVNAYPQNFRKIIQPNFHHAKRRSKTYQKYHPTVFTSTNYVSLHIIAILERNKNPIMSKQKKCLNLSQKNVIE